MDDEMLGLVIMVAWCMWFNRNVVRQGKGRQQNVAILQRATYLMAEFQTDNFKLAQPIISDTVLWTPPIMSLYRINIGVIIRNHAHWIGRGSFKQEITDTTRTFGNQS